ncbi:MAG: SRPBCC family protein [Deltaproteobacteria bacterium]|nr:SRPBCC family protein [Deltaproteobacteria bacterium]
MFTYVTYIATTPERLWTALTSAEDTQRYWSGRCIESDWQPSGLVTIWADAQRRTLDVTGELLVVEPPRRLLYSFQAYPGGEVLRERPSRVAFDLVPLPGGVVKLSLTHDQLDADSMVIPLIRAAWPAILSSLKSLLETGTALPLDADWEL